MVSLWRVLSPCQLRVFSIFNVLFKVFLAFFILVVNFFFYYFPFNFLAGVFIMFSKELIIPLIDFRLKMRSEGNMLPNPSGACGQKLSDTEVKYSAPNEDSHRKKKVLSAYEQMIQKNREEKMAILKSIKIEEAKASMAEYVENSRRKKFKPVKEKVQTPKSPAILRRSKRLANLSVDLSEDVSTIELANRPARKENLTIPPEMTFKEALVSEDFYDSYGIEVSQESDSEAKLISYDKCILSQMTVNEPNIAQVTPYKIFALSWYPSLEPFIVAAGDMWGYLGVWNVDSKSSPFVFKIHRKGITNLKFSPYHREQIISSSRDGILRCGDMIQHNFYELYNVSAITSCSYFDFLSASSFLVSQKNGQVALVDKRIGGKNCEVKHTCHDHPIITVNIHPVNKNFFITAGYKGAIRLWDLRNLQSEPVADITYHRKCVFSAFFSPVTGNSILATCKDNSISIFDSTNLTSDIKLKLKIRHDNERNSSLGGQGATWLPNSEDSFMIGSYGNPRRIDVFDKSMSTYSLMHNSLTSLTLTNEFHPLRPALAGGCNSGPVFVFT